MTIATHVIPAGYKQTEVGVIPEDWEVKKLGNVGSFSKGRGIRKDQSQNGELPCIRYGELYTQHGIFIKKYYSYISSEIADTAKKLAVGDILFAGSGETKEEIGKCAAFLDNIVAFAGGDIVVFSPNNMNSLFLGYLLNSRVVVMQKASKGQGDAIVHISASNLQEVNIPLPPTKAEQEAIATALCDADALIESLERLIAKKRLIKQGAMQELLTGKKRLPGFEKKPGYKQTETGLIPEDWELHFLGDIVIFLDGKRRPIKDTDRANMRGSIPYYGASGIIDYVNDYLFDEDLILLGEDGENILSRNCRLAFHISGKVWVNNHAHVLKPNPDVNIGFLTDYLESINYDQLNSGTAQPKLTKHTCYRIKIPLPPTINEQEAIATILSDMDAEIDALEAKLSKAHNIKQGMMQELLTGRIRLV